MRWTYQLVFVLSVIIIPEHVVHCRTTPQSKVLIKKIEARQIFDSRGNPTVEVDLYTDLHNDQYFRAAVPSGASTGAHEALELRDTTAPEYMGKGVLQAVDNINKVLGPALIEKEFNVTDQRDIDRFMLQLDGTDNKAKYGANAILGVSMAACKAGAAAKEIPLYQHIADLSGTTELILPVPAFNVINGGEHAGNGLAMQEFMVLPVGASSFREAMRMGSEIYHHLKKVITKRYGKAATAVGDEGGFAPNIEDDKQALELIKEAIASAGLEGKIKIGMDAAASEFYRNGAYDLHFKDANSNASKFLKPEELADLYRSFIKEYPLVTLEDPFEQDDWSTWQTLMSNTEVQIVGDDLTVTNPKRIRQAIHKKAANCLLLKINQIGSITESIEAFILAKENGWGTMVSHRSGETEDTFIADLAVGLGCGQIKSGAPCRSERTCKYNQLLRIEEATGAKYAGESFRKPWESV